MHKKIWSTVTDTRERPAASSPDYKKIPRLGQNWANSSLIKNQIATCEDLGPTSALFMHTYIPVIKRRSALNPIGQEPRYETLWGIIFCWYRWAYMTNNFTWLTQCRTHCLWYLNLDFKSKWIVLFCSMHCDLWLEGKSRLEISFSFLNIGSGIVLRYYMGISRNVVKKPFTTKKHPFCTIIISFFNFCIH